ncbi:Bgt-51941 [Blumeria graminis f. sp. tritici]|uniref:Bgt-51941 n=1 Tax=Blumeria graminis f. sp. tritici TaxID=62690 RepID=A0A9X9MPS1_BLUGR|nr:Bgt-51941 [Blumeria graminis f. sp. tritici]
MSSSEVLGIINVVDENEKCVTLWDLSSTSSEAIYSPSSILDLDRVQDSIWPETCFGHEIKTKTMWLYLEFAMKNWKSKYNGRKLNFPIVNQKAIWLWPMRTPETHIKTFTKVFAIGQDTRSGTYTCLEYSPEIIRHLKGIFGPATKS